ncbi:hypothetical protein [Halostagnicola sp. A-GB9-2]|uniref:hypothetical protein n=1 Tax=Halostagnicola sp. A-GB9-2 TaxID=3048066 RepID=UPI0024C0DF11|nr:hypothetical protein [Halostagnicola sp. A-GB9-2]MDJ1432658.1 hypothetical protein [Halostagnicola sp. A-GB9-2]
MTERGAEPGFTGIPFRTRLWTIFPLFPLVSVTLETSGVVGNPLDSALSLVLGLALAVFLSELLLRAVGPAIVDPLWYGVFVLVGGALVVLTTAPMVDLEPEAIQRPAYTVLLTCSALAVVVATRQRLE